MMADSAETDPSDGVPLSTFGVKSEEPKIAYGSVDATTYLLQSEANRKRLLATIENINTGRNLVEIPEYSDNAGV